MIPFHDRCPLACAGASLRREPLPLPSALLPLLRRRLADPPAARECPVSAVTSAIAADTVAVVEPLLLLLLLLLEKLPPLPHDLARAASSRCSSTLQSSCVRSYEENANGPSSSDAVDHESSLLVLMFDVPAGDSVVAAEVFALSSPATVNPAASWLSATIESAVVVRGCDVGCGGCKGWVDCAVPVRVVANVAVALGACVVAAWPVVLMIGAGAAAVEGVGVGVVPLEAVAVSDRDRESCLC